MQSMQGAYLLLLYTATWIPNVAPSVLSWPESRSLTACQQLSDKYSKLVALPNSTTYNEEKIGK